jgi:hypothetical protein
MTLHSTSQRLLTALFLGSCTWLVATSGQAQVSRPNGHEHYTAEIEPHLVVQWEDQPAWNDDGIGVGLRASIPVMQDGPVTSINNSLALGFGLDWAHFGNDCFGPGPNPGPGRNCSANDFWVPLVVQWNFFFSDLISAFPELGLGIHHTTWDGYYCTRNGNVNYFCGSGSDTGVDLVLWLGVRFHLSHSFAITLRLGTPSLLLGASFFL